MQRIHDHLLLEEEYVENQERLRKAKAVKEGNAPAPSAEGEGEDRNADERSRVDDMRGSPMGVGNLEELIDDDHAIVSSATGPEYYVSIMSFVDKDLLEPGASILLHHKSVSVVGVLTDDADPLVSVMKLDKAPTESYADIGGLEQQIQEVREAVELPLLHPELYEEMGIKPPKGVILYGAPGTGKTLLAKAVANQTSATFLRIVGSEPLVPSDTSRRLAESARFSALCWSCSTSWTVSMTGATSRSSWRRTKLRRWTLP
jgi:26S proteasome regulatory subunit T2